MQTKITLEVPFIDNRGKIQNVARHLGSAVLIESNAGSVRAQHWHRKDSHQCYVVSGKIIYVERPVGSKEQPTAFAFNPGDLFFTPPEVEHAMFFPVDTVFWTFADRERTPEDYEADLVRLTEPLAQPL